MYHCGHFNETYFLRHLCSHSMTLLAMQDGVPLIVVFCCKNVPFTGLDVLQWSLVALPRKKRVNISWLITVTCSARLSFADFVNILSLSSVSEILYIFPPSSATYHLISFFYLCFINVCTNGFLLLRYLKK